TPAEKMTPELVQKVMGAWKTWMENLGSAMIDMGFPMANGRTVVDDGSAGTPPLLTGYSIIQAKDIDAALKLIDGHPFLSDKTGKFSVEVYELLPVPM
ncbi:MAG: YciI family protein, partial [Patescibacteria group bacterium]